MKRRKGSNVCEICRYRCVRRDHMTQHMLVHSDQRLFVCPVDGCALDFKRRDHLVRHVKLKHNVGEQPNVCSTSFDSNSTLRLAPQAEFPTEAAGPKTSESDMKRTILELREENARLQRELVAEREKYREHLERWSKDLDSSATKSKSLELTVEAHELRTYRKKKGRSPIVLAQHSGSASEPTVMVQQAVMPTVEAQQMAANTGGPMSREVCGDQEEGKRGEQLQKGEGGRACGGRKTKRGRMGD